MPESGTGTTTSASAGCSRARRAPNAWREVATLFPKTFESGRAKYTCSKMQGVEFANAKRRDEKPSRDRRTISPGSTSRSKRAPIRSNAHVSEATTGEPSRVPSESGRIPLGSRAAKIPSRDRTRMEYAPRTSRSASARAEGRSGARERATRWRMTSESEVVVKRAPEASRPRRISRALTRLPLCASARGPRPVANTMGCALASRDAPVVEYRTWPIAVRPGSRDSLVSSKTSATYPISRSMNIRSSSSVAIPADS